MKYSQIKYINNDEKGLGGAISAGIRNSTGKFVCIMMSDSSDTVEDLNKYFEPNQAKEIWLSYNFALYFSYFVEI